MTKVDLITGFLGAGKTTFLARYGEWLGRQGCRFTIIGNEFGGSGIDHAVLLGIFGNVIGKFLHRQLHGAANSRRGDNGNLANGVLRLELALDGGDQSAQALTGDFGEVDVRIGLDAHQHGGQIHHFL